MTFKDKAFGIAMLTFTVSFPFIVLAISYYQSH